VNGTLVELYIIIIHITLFINNVFIEFINKIIKNRFDLDRHSYAMRKSENHHTYVCVVQFNIETNNPMLKVGVARNKLLAAKCLE